MSISEKLTIIAENEQRVYDSGYEKGKSEGGSGSNKLPQIIDGTVTELTAEDLAGVTAIRKYACYQNPNLTSVTIPDSATKIDEYAFYGCANLMSVVIGEGVTKIGTNAFRGCRNITSIAIPDNVTSIDNYAFSECKGLTSVYYDGDIASWCNIDFGLYDGSLLLFAENLYLKNGSETYELVTDVVIPDGVTTTRYGTFEGYSHLKSAIVPNSVKYIYGTFKKCDSLATVRIGKGITSIASSAFNSCSTLTDIYIDKPENSISGAPWGAPNSPTIHWNTPLPSEGLEFYKDEYGYIYVSGIGTCTDTDIVIPDKYGAFYVDRIAKSAFDGCSSITSVRISDKITRIDDFAFFNCPNLTSVNIGNGVTEIMYRVFGYCSNLTSVTIGNSITHIGNFAFEHCSSLTSITIPNNVTNIGEGAFEGCTNLTDIYINKPKDSISGAPWRAPNENVTIHWNA